MKDETSYDTRLNDYLHNNLSDEQRHAFELEFNEDPFLLDAMEGLMDLNNPQMAKDVQEQLNQFIKNKTSKKKEKRSKPIQFPTWLILLIATVFLMAIAGIVLIKWLTA